MKVVFCLYGNKMHKTAAMMVASCKKFNYEVWQLSDHEAPEVAGVSRVIRQPYEQHSLFVFRGLSELEPPYLKLDTDLFVVKDISDIEDTKYDVALTVRGDPGMGMIYNGGVFWVNNKQFAIDCLKLVEGMSPDRQAWFGDQIAMAQVAKNYRVNELPCSTWNHTPVNEHDMGRDSRILHFKGPRKNWMGAMYRRVHE